MLNSKPWPQVLQFGSSTAEWSYAAPSEQTPVPSSPPKIQKSEQVRTCQAGARCPQRELCLTKLCAGVAHRHPAAGRVPTLPGPPGPDRTQDLRAPRAGREQLGAGEPVPSEHLWLQAGPALISSASMQVSPIVTMLQEASERFQARQAQISPKPPAATQHVLAARSAHRQAWLRCRAEARQLGAPSMLAVVREANARYEVQQLSAARVVLSPASRGNKIVVTPWPWQRA